MEHSNNYHSNNTQISLKYHQLMEHPVCKCYGKKLYQTSLEHNVLDAITFMQDEVSHITTQVKQFLRRTFADEQLNIRLLLHK